MSLATSDREQANWAGALEYALDYKLEHEIRAMAKMAAEHPLSFTSGGLILPYAPRLSYLSQGLPSPDEDGSVPYHEIRVCLWHGLQNKPSLGQLIAEQIIREQIGEFTARLARRQHIIQHPQMVVQQVRDEPWGDSTQYELRCMIDGTILTARQVVPRRRTVAASNLVSHERQIKGRMAHELLHKLGDYLGFGEWL